MKESLHRNWRSVFIALSLLIDILAIGATGFFSFKIRSFLPNVHAFADSVFYEFTLWFGVLLIGSGLFLGLYRGAFHLDNRRLYFLAGRAYFYSVLVVLASFYILGQLDFPKKYTLLFFILLPVFFSFGRAILHSFNRSLQLRGFGLHKTLLVGYDDSITSMLERLWESPELGYQILGMVSRRKPSNLAEYEDLEIPWYRAKDFERVVQKERITRVFIPSADLTRNGYSGIVESCRKQGVKLKVLSPIADQLLRLAKVYDIAGITLSSPARQKVESLKKALKRGVDIIGAIVALLLLSPVLTLTAIAIYVESGLPVLYKQKRCALKGGKTFHFYKFRSMIKNADELKDSLLDRNESDGALFKLRNDPRMTKVGKFIRKYSIDELPQLINVLKGEMSLVGPRPLPIGDFDKVKEPKQFWEFIKDRERVKPGMTGLWQISGRSNIGFSEMVLLDLYYAENHSLLFDLEIIAATVPVVLFSRGAY